MFQKRATAATNSGEKTPANVPQLRKFSNKRREFSGKCSKKPPKQQQMPEKKLPQMFLKTTKTLALYALATKLALEAPRTSNLSELPLRVAFAR